MRKKYLFIKVICFVLFLGIVNSFAQTKEEQSLIVSKYDLQRLKQMENEFRESESQKRQYALQYAQQKGIQTKIDLDDGGYAELQSIDPDGNLLYYRTYNIKAAKSTRTDLLNTGDFAGLDLYGQNMTAYVWDVGHARLTHVEYSDPGGGSRVSAEDVVEGGAPFFNNHATHVTGTITASGVNSAAKGMAPQSYVKSYTWTNDLTEATVTAAEGMLISNHSYGYENYYVPDYYFGGYITMSRNWDNLLYNTPYYLMVTAAGNYGTNDYNESPLDPDNPQYDKLTGFNTSKNNLVVASAQVANIDSEGNLISVNISPFSSQGPTDDLRIKPDITGNGQVIYSTNDAHDDAYGNMQGTSMAAPNVSGSLLLLQQHANTINGFFMKAATLKGLVLHTADDAGPTGPDAIWGWGLMNSKRAAEAISQNGDKSLIKELTLFPNQTYTIEVESDGINDLMASISWTDPLADATTELNSPIPRLTNDLDIRVSKGGTTYFPWRLTAVNANDKGDNIRDPFERIDVANASGNYTITITHKGTLAEGHQNYSLIVTGLSSVVCNATPPSVPEPFKISDTSATLFWDEIDIAVYDVRYRNTSSLSTIFGPGDWTTTTTTTNHITLNNLSPKTKYELQVRSKCPGGTESSYSASAYFVTLEEQYCASSGYNINLNEYIGRVQLNTIDNWSDYEYGYSDFTNLSTTLMKGQSYSITITPVIVNVSHRKETFSVWIDYNQNGHFEDPEELVHRDTRTVTSMTPVSGSFTIPASALNGSTRMRISMKFLEYATPCEIFTYGEVEDYTVVISDGLTRRDAVGNSAQSGNDSFMVYPNPVEGKDLYLALNNGKATEVKVYNITGQLITKKPFSGIIDVSELQSGVYFVEVDGGEQKFVKRFIKK